MLLTEVLRYHVGGNRMFMAALDAGCASAGCARTRRPQWSTYALFFSLFLSCFFSLISFLSLSTPLLPQVFPFLQPDTINDLHLCSIQTMCLLHLSYSTPLRKTLTVNHYLRIEWYFQHMLLVPKLFRASGVGIYDIPPESSLLPSFIEWELMSFSLHNQEGLDSRVKYLL